MATDKEQLQLTSKRVLTTVKGRKLLAAMALAVAPKDMA